VKASVIIATYKRPPYLSRCLEELEKQIEKPDEVLVVGVKNDEETINFMDKARNLDLNVKAFFISRKGIVAAENKGLSESRGDIICFIDDDAYPAKDWVYRIKKSFLENPRLGAVGGPCVPCVDGEPVIKKTNLVGRILWFGYFIGNSDKLTNYAIYVDHLAGCNMSLQRKLIDFFDEKLVGDAYMFETDACLSIKKRGFKILYNPDIRVYHHQIRLKEFQKGLPSSVIYARAHNRSYIFMKHFSPIQRLIFIIYDLLIGEPSTPGLIITLTKSLLRRKAYFLTELIPSIKGKISGLQTFHNMIKRS